MNEEKRKEKPDTKPRKKLSSNILIVLLLFFVLLIGGSLIGELLVSPFYSLPDPYWWISENYLSFIGIHLLVLLYTFFTNRGIFHKYLFGSKGNNWKMLLLGFLIGFLMNGACILFAWLHRDIYFMSGNMTVAAFVFAFISVFVQSAAEELICRGYLYYYVKERHSTVLAVLLSACIFSAVHLGNPGISPLALINIALVGATFVICVYCFDSLWMAMAIHASWNFTQNLIFGLPNSGIVSEVSIVKLDASTAADSFFYNVDFGIESTAMAAIVIVVSNALMVLYHVKKSK